MLKYDFSKKSGSDEEEEDETQIKDFISKWC